MDAGSGAVQIEGLTRVFGSGDDQVVALRALDLEIPPRQVLGVLGSNGAGKTTLIKILSTLLLPTSGRVRLSGHDVVTDVKAVRRATAVVFGGERGLYQRLSAKQNLMFLGMLRGLTRRDLRLRVPQALEQVGLADRSQSPVETFSKGMKQRLHLAIGLLETPEVLLLDEPTVGLDPIEADRIREVIAGFPARGTTVLLTSHYLYDIERLADRVVLIRDGAVAHDMPTSRFLAQARYVATVEVFGHGAAPDLSAAGEAEVSAGNDEWRAVFEVEAWDSSTFARLGAFLDGLDITDVRVKPYSLEAVFKLLAESGAESGR